MIKLKIGNRKTNAYKLIESAHVNCGVKVTQRAKGYTNFRDLQYLVRIGYLTTTHTGPKGGLRYLATGVGVDTIARTY